MKISKEELEQVKKDHPGDLYEGDITFNDENNKLHTIGFIWRKPTLADIEAHSRTAQRNPIVANINLIQSLIVYPDSGGVIAQIQEHPASAGHFVDEAISPFYGANVAVKTRKI
ncbi:MAG: hypothetical protein LBF77_09900 [Spirochaetaceae bacterium]|jgi:hypothetical protein|nr:hypothetical protein [Spirochaetaceae bacterium]